MTVGKLRFITFVWFLFMYGSCLCSFVMEKNCLKVSSPENVKGTYECAVSNIGIPQHGGTLTGVVVYPKVNQNACNSFSHEFNFKTKTHAGSLPVFLLADRGDCYFDLKARNAQDAGAAGILVANDDFLTTMYFPGQVDIYNMENLSIPSAIISRSLGDSLKKALYDGKFVRVNLEWTEGFTHQDEQVDTGIINISECQSNYCDDQTQEHESDEQVDTDKINVIECHSDYCYEYQTQECESGVPSLSRFMWRFVIKSTPFWGFLLMNVKSWLMFLWQNGIIGSVLKFV